MDDRSQVNSKVWEGERRLWVEEEKKKSNSSGAATAYKVFGEITQVLTVAGEGNKHAFYPVVPPLCGSRPFAQISH